MKTANEGIIAVFVRNPVLANLLALGTMIGGTVAALKLPRETFPETATNFVVITVPYPGASAEDVERGVSIKIEEAVQGIPGLGEISSVSGEDSSQVLVEYNPRVITPSEVLRQIQDRVNTIRTFPPDAERPLITEATVRLPVISIGVSGDASETVIQRVAEQIRDELSADPQISQVSLSGVRDYQISIQLTEETLQRYGLTLREVIERVSASSLDLPAGTIRTRSEEIHVRTTGQRYTTHDFSDLVVIARPDGSAVRLGEIAEIRDAFEDTPLYGRVNGQPGATVIVAKTSTEDISTIARIVRAYVDKVRTRVPEGIHLTVLADKSRDVDERLNMLLVNAVQGMALLTIVLMVFMDFRAAMGVAMGIPVATAGALWVLHVTGSTLNMISLFGLLLADAIVLDDSIVIAESIVAAEKEGLTPEMAAIRATRSVTLPVATSSITTIVMFVPLMYVEGVMGKLIYVLPVAVIATIVASAVEAFWILPAHMAHWAHRGGKGRFAQWRVRVRRRLNDTIESVIGRLYTPIITRLAEYRWVVLAGTAGFVLICLGVVLGGHTPFVLFPKLDTNTLRARVRFPEGTPVALAHAAVDRIEQAARALNDHPELRPASAGNLVQHVYSTVGEWTDFVSKRGSGLCQTTIELMPSEDRRLDCALVIARWREAIGAVPGAELLSIEREELGPNEKPLEIRLLGNDLDELRRAADEVRAKLAAFEGVFDIDDDLRPGKRELRVVLKPEASTLGLTLASLAEQLRQGLYGGEAVRLQRGRDDVRVLVSYVDADRRDWSILDRLRIRTPAGGVVPFHEVAETRLVRGHAEITRQDGMRRVRIQADVDEHHANAERIISTMLAGFLPDLDERYAGVTYRIDGQRARIDQSLTSLAMASLVAFALSYAILGAATRSYLQPLILIAAVPLGLCGAVLGHTVMGFELSLMSVFGMTSLSGIVVNDGLVLLDQLNRNVESGMNIREAVAKAARARVLAVFLTAVTNAAGLLPLLTERSTQALPLIPIAISVVFGLTFSTVLVLLIVPSLYLVFNDAKRLALWLRRGGAYPRPEEVERTEASHAAVPA